MQLPEAYICHETPGRLRLKIPIKKGNRMFFTDLQQPFTEWPRCQKLAVNAATGSVLVAGDRLEASEVARFAESKHLFTLVQKSAEPVTVPHEIVKPLRQADAMIARYTGGMLDLSGAIFVWLMGIGIFQMVRRGGSPPWYTAFWYAFGIFSRMLVKKAEKSPELALSPASETPAPAAS